MNCTALRAVDRHSAKYRLRSAQAFVYGLKGKRLIQVEAIDIEKYFPELGGQGELTAAEGRAAGVDTALSGEIRTARLMVTPGSGMDVAAAVRAVDVVQGSHSVLMPNV